MTGFRAGEIVYLVDAPLGAHDMIGRIVEIAESRVFHMPARWRRDTSLRIDSMPMQLVCKPKTREPLGCYPVAWMRPYNGEEGVRERELQVIAEPSHKWLIIDPANALMR